MKWDIEDYMTDFVDFAAHLLTFMIVLATIPIWIWFYMIYKGVKHLNEL